jgi:hypothetical protein
MISTLQSELPNSEGGAMKLGCLFVFLGLAGSSLPLSAASSPLTSDQVACQELQLERLERRFNTSLGGNPSIFFWQASPGGGRFEGLFVPLGIHFETEGLIRTEEEQLSFEVFFKDEALLLNPARLPLVETTLVRRDVESTLRAPDPDRSFDIGFEAAGGAINAFYPRVPVQISGVLAERSATRVGRGPVEDDLLSACQPEPTAADAKILRILSRSLRPTCWVSPAFSCNSFGLRYKVTLFRTEEPYSYRANVYFYVKDCDDDDPPERQCPYSEPERVSLEFRFEHSGGRLTTGTVRVLPPCTGEQTRGCSLGPFFEQGIFILPPLWAGHETQGSAELARGAHLMLFPGCEKGCVLSADLDWADLLRDTTWNEGFD